MTETPTTIQPLHDGRRISIDVKDLTCIAQLLQSAITHNGDPYAVCDDCRYCCHTTSDLGGEEKRSANAEIVLWRLCQVTGVKITAALMDCTMLWMLNPKEQVKPKIAKCFMSQEIYDSYYGTKEQREAWKNKAEKFLKRGY